MNRPAQGLRIQYIFVKTLDNCFHRPMIPGLLPDPHKSIKHCQHFQQHLLQYLHSGWCRFQAYQE
uniref:Uncharacterized protein n=1 Tax=uncultured marine virus TaxID=186617 RepID=A0A0F7L4U3_9VIRU|nr:hypothetical protein [uncultured marine virus]